MRTTHTNVRETRIIFSPSQGKGKGGGKRRGEEEGSDQGGKGECHGENEKRFCVENESGVERESESGRCCIRLCGRPCSAMNVQQRAPDAGRVLLARWPQRRRWSRLQLCRGRRVQAAGGLELSLCSCAGAVALVVAQWPAGANGRVE